MSKITYKRFSQQYFYIKQKHSTLCCYEPPQGIANAGLLSTSENVKKHCDIKRLQNSYYNLKKKKRIHSVIYLLIRCHLDGMNPSRLTPVNVKQGGGEDGYRKREVTVMTMKLF